MFVRWRSPTARDDRLHRIERFGCRVPFPLQHASRRTRRDFGGFRIPLRAPAISRSIGSDQMDALPDMSFSHAQTYTAIYRGTSSMETAIHSAIERGRAFSRSHHNASMEKRDPPSLKLAIERLLDERAREDLASRNAVAGAAGRPESTVRSATKPSGNPTLRSLNDIANAFGITVSELLDYGEPDWQARILARRMANSILKEMKSPEEALDLEAAVQSNRAKKKTRRARAASSTSDE